MNGAVRLTFLCTSALLILLLASPAVKGQDSTADRDKISLTEIESTLRTLEDPEALEALKAQLRALLAAQQAAVPSSTPPKPAPFTRRVTQLGRVLGMVPGRTLGVLSRIGADLGNIRKRLAEPEYRYMLLDLLLKLALAMAAAIATFTVIHRLLRRFHRATTPEEATWQPKVATAAFNVGIGVAPAVAAYVFVTIFLSWMRVPAPHAQAISMVIAYLVLYRLLAGAIREVLAPGDTAKRIAPLGDEVAAYWARWGMQVLRFAVFGYLVVALLRVYATGSVAASAACILYRIGWIAFIAAALSRWRRPIIRRLLVPELWEGRPRGARQRTVRLYNLGVERLYGALLAYIIFLALVALLGYQHLFMWLVQRTVTTAVLLAAGYGIQRLLALGFVRAQRSEERLRSRYPEIGRRGSRYLRLLHSIALAISWALFAGFILEAWGVPAFEAMSGGAGGLIVERIVLIALALVLAVLFINICASVIERLMQPRPDPTTGQVPEISQQRKTLLPLLNKVVMYVTFFVAGLVILDQIGINPGPILAGAGIVGLAVGFGAQTLVKDVIGGFFILFENQIRVGDVVVIGGKGGLVEAMNLRTLVLRDLAGVVHIIPCGSIDKVMNMTKEYSCYVLDLGVSYREDVDEVMEVVKETFDELMRDPDFGPDIIEPLEIFGVDDFADSQVTIRTRITTKPIKQWRVAREFRRRIKKTFDERGIEIPFPHQTIYMGEPKKTPPPPLHVRLEQEMESAFLGPDEGAEQEDQHDEQSS